MFPLRGLWNTAPAEGDKFISCEVDWGQTVPLGQAVQCALSGNSPVNFSQIVAMTVDNTRCGSDVQFVFTDSGFVLQVPAYNQGVYPVFTNALMFYVIATNAAGDDVTSFNIHNSMPPPVQISNTQEVNQASVTGIDINNAGTFPVIPASVAGGTITGFNIMIESAIDGTATLILKDGNGTILWELAATLTVGQSTPITVTGLRLRFFNGVQFQVLTPTGSGAAVANINIYYGVP